MFNYRYYLVEQSLGWHKVLPEPQVVLLCPTTVRAQTLWYARSFALYAARLGPKDRQPSEEHCRHTWRFLRERALPLWPGGPLMELWLN